jgi:putative transposon-encoded protein
MMTPDLAAKGEEITGMVVVDTDKGEVPLSEGAEVIFQGTVVPVGPGGKIKLPGFLKDVFAAVCNEPHRISADESRSALRAVS